VIEDSKQDLYLAIKKDNLISFDKYVQSEHILDLSFGRFPILTLAYLYNSRRIIRKYEDKLLSIRSYTKIDENYEMYSDFKQKAGRCLRLYINQNTISPLEMLAILGQVSRLEKVYPKAMKNSLIIENISSIEMIKLSKEVQASETKISLPKQPLTQATKRHLIGAGAVLAIFMVVFVAFGLVVLHQGIGTQDYPYTVMSAAQFKSALSADKYIVLSEDIEMESLYLDSFSGTIDGNGHSIKLTNQTASIFDTLIGNLSNITIDATISIDTTTTFGVITNNLKGSISDVNIKMSGEIKYIGPNVENTNVYLSLIAAKNEGTISNIIIDSDVTISQDGTTSVVYGGISSYNKGTISSVQASGALTLIELNGTPINYANYGTISNVSNSSTITQEYSSPVRNMLSGSISDENYSTISNCSNTGTFNIKSTSQNGTYIYCGGIVSINLGVINACKNEGDISIHSQYSYYYVGSIVARCEIYAPTGLVETKPEINSCAAKGSISLTNVNTQSCGFIGGVVGHIQGYTSLSKNYSLVDFFQEGELYVGCITGFVGLLEGSGNSMLDNAYLKTSTLEHGIYVTDFWQYRAYDTGDGMFLYYLTEDEIKALEIYW